MLSEVIWAVEGGEADPYFCHYSIMIVYRERHGLGVEGIAISVLVLRILGGADLPGLVVARIQ